MNKSSGGFASCGSFKIVLFCSFLFVTFLSISCGNKAFANEATSHFRITTCAEVSLDNGVTYGTIKNKLGSNGVKYYWPIYTYKDKYDEYEYSKSTDDANESVNIDVENGCISTWWAYWPGANELYRGGLRIRIDESGITDKIKNISNIKFRFRSTVNLVPLNGVYWSVVDYRTIWNDQNNDPRYNKVIGFCTPNQDCPITTSMYGTLEQATTGRDMDRIEEVAWNSKSFLSDVGTISLYTGDTTTLSYGVTMNYAVKNTILGNNIVDIKRCDAAGNNCGVSSRASVDSFVQLVYKSAPKHNLTAYARPDTSSYFNANGAVTTKKSEGWTNKKTVNYNGSATVTTDGFNPAGYTWNKWGTSCNSVTTRNCTKNNITSDTEVFAYYTRNSFQGHAYVSNTPDFGNGTSRAQTGWVSNDKDVSTEIDCPNNGCSVYFWLKLLTVAGSGKTSYQYGKQINNGTVNWLPSSTTYYNIAPSKVKDGQNATYIRGASGNGQNEPLNPGDKICYYLKFKPYGSLSNDTYKTISACATAKETTFKGKSNISGATSSNMDYQSANKTITSTISNCSSISGCKVSFSHWLKRSGSSGATAYTISRTSNLTGDDRGIENDRGIQNNSNLKSGTFDSSEAEVFNSGTLTLYPGMVVCETLKFKTSNTSSGKDVSTTVCASALGKAQPDPGEDGSNAFIKIEVKNNNVKKYNTFGHIVYAKPGDELTYRATYDPILQYTYYLIPQKMRINGGTIYPTSGTNSTSSLGTMFDSNKGSLKGWNNAFSIQRKFSSQEDNFDGASTLSNYTYGNGNTEKRNEQHDYNVSSSNIGKSIGEKAITNLNDTTKTTPKQVTFENDNNTNRGNVDTGAISSTAFARIPYNFILNSEIKNPEGENIVYAGEKSTIHYNINLEPKKNCETSDDCGEYTTHVSNPEIRLIVYYPTDGPSKIPGISSWGDSNTNDLCSYYGLTNNQNSCSHEKAYNNLSISKSIENSEATFYVKDLNAGSNVCVAIANYPSTSGADTNWNDSEGNHRWSISESVCYTVAKKPSIQVWGGNVYSRNKINTATSIKNYLDGVMDYDIFNKNATNYVFGSWGELGVIAGNTVTGFASGATMGYEQNNNGALLPNPQGENGNNSGIVGGNKEDINKTLFCNRVPLSFANSECGQTSTSSIGISTSSNSIKQDKSSIISTYILNDIVENRVSNNLVTLTSPSDQSFKYKDTNVYYYYNGNNNDLTLSGGIVEKGTVQVVHSGKNIIITGNIEYDTAGGYANFQQMPKLVVYAKNIYIDCEVTSIDALLIADDKVITCNNFDADNINSIKEHINEKANSKQLKINGAVIANSLIPNRTYGAATGANSIVPAEIINFDPTLYMWGGDNTDNEEQKVDVFNVVYTSEVSTRF